MKPLICCFFLLLLNITTICVNIIPAVQSLCNEDQQTLLLQLKKSLTFSEDLTGFNPVSSTKLITWKASADCCSWVGVTCSADGSVVGLDISSQFISGGIDNSSSLFSLQHLQSLNLANNKFNYPTSIPSTIGKLSNLRYLNLSHNAYSGQIPMEISHLTKLVVLDLSDIDDILTPKFSMLIFQNLTRLKEIYLDALDLSEYRTWWCQAISSSLPNLTVLSLSGTGLSGPIDQSLTKLRSLAVVRLGGNDISGPIPEFFANFANLKILSLEGNNISASVPGFFANFSKLTSLSLKFCSLSGTFPKEIFQLPTLQTIELSGNQLHGSLPEFTNNGSLQHLDLSFTNFSGSLPESIGNLKMLSTIDVSYSSFTGSIPKSMENLTQLVYLELSSNMLNGPISSIQWDNLINLVYIRMEDNLLEGSIPSSLFSLPLNPALFLSHNHFSGQLQELLDANASSTLLVLDLSFNNLEGPVPLSIYKLRGLVSLDLFSNNFSAFPFNGPQQLTNLTNIDLSHNNLQMFFNGTRYSYSSFPQIQFLNLASNQLRTIPDFLRNLSTLSELDLSVNQIPGEIPNWVWRLNSLNLSSNHFVTVEAPLFNSSMQTLDLHLNEIQGEIPTFLQNPLYLDYSRNHFSSTIPPYIGNFLSDTSFLSLSSNDLHGIIPVSLCNASFDLLDLSSNSLSGTIPECLTSTGTLRVLNLRRNNLTGTISNFQFPEQSMLQTLDLSENQIEGQFPKSLANCTLLEILILGNNLIQDVFPCMVMDVYNMRILVLRSNKFYGSISCPKTIKNSDGTWGLLQIIDLAHNNFGGEIPGGNMRAWHAMLAHDNDFPPLVNYLEYSQDQGRDRIAFSFRDAITITSKGSQMNLAKILVVFTLIDFSSNKFNGTIPEEMGEFKSLYVLNLSNNALTGQIPSSFGNMRQLESLDLSQNNLSGQIPAELANLTFLSFLNLSNNQLVGKIPTSTQFSTFSRDSFTGNKGLWGPPLTVEIKAGLSPAPAFVSSLPDSRHQAIDWDMLSVEIGFAFGLGVAILPLLFCKRWSNWYYQAMYNILVKLFPKLNQIIGNQRWRG